MAEGRNIPKSSFIEQFLGSRDTTERISREFGNKVTIFLVKKDFEKNTVEDIVEIGVNKAKIDDHIEKRYTKEDLEKYL